MAIQVGSAFASYANNDEYTVWVAFLILTWVHVIANYKVKLKYSWAGMVFTLIKFSSN